MYRTFYPTTIQYTFFSSALGTYNKLDKIMALKQTLTLLKDLKIKCAFFDHNGIKLEINNRVITGNFIALSAYIRKAEKSQINKMNSHLKNLEKEEQNKPKESRRKEIIKVRMEINENIKQKNNRKINK